MANNDKENSDAFARRRGDCDISVSRLLDLNHTIASALFEGVDRPWEVLPRLKAFIPALGATLDPEKFDRRSGDVWIAKTARVYESAYIEGPCIIDEHAEIRHCAFIRGCAIVGKNAVVGNSVELKNCVLFDCAQTPHFNYVGDSVLGYKSHMGAGAITSNVRSDKASVRVRVTPGAPAADTGLQKFGAILGDFVEVGCNGVLNPGTIVGRHAMIYPTACVRGVVPENGIVKSNGDTVVREVR